MGNLKKNDEFIIVNLIKYGLSKQTNAQFDEYILSSFDAFCQNKQEIIMDLRYILRANETIRNLLFYPIEIDSVFNDRKRAADDNSNLFRLNLLLLFSNAESLIINTGGNQSFS